MNTKQNSLLLDVLLLDWKVDELDWKVDEIEWDIEPLKWDIEPIVFEPFKLSFNQKMIRESDKSETKKNVKQM